ncbi:AfsA-related hotdog domain-containing protein [Microbispora hainanensis]|uniref:AfsA-related hotdog domain-containing protein n=1 Tax=Microbispora hainanensis TaxID=568844 RepID=UPI0033CECF61
MMTVDLEVADDPVSAAELRFNRTMERTLVHRTSVAEVFVTDMALAGPQRLLVAAQLPLSHGYYSDHPCGPGLFDPLLILEAGRQAGIAGGHMLGFPPDTIMMVDRFELDLPDADALRIGRLPGELLIDSRFEVTRLRRGRVRQGVVRQDLRLGDRHAGTHEMQVQVVSHDELAALRTVVRGTPAPSTGEMPDDAGPLAAPPAVVGRNNPLNVVLAQVERGEAGAWALVRPRFGNRSLFDHDYDHLPAMVLTEAARQLAVVACGDAVVWPVSVTGGFRRFAELDLPVHAAAVRVPSGASGDRARGSGAGGPARDRVDVSFTQDGTVIAEVTLAMVRHG